MTKWVAMDSDGDVCIYNEKPKLEMYTDSEGEQAYAWCGDVNFEVLYTLESGKGYAQSLVKVKDE